MKTTKQETLHVVLVLLFTLAFICAAVMLSPAYGQLVIEGQHYGCPVKPTVTYQDHDGTHHHLQVRGRKHYYKFKAERTFAPETMIYTCGTRSRQMQVITEPATDPVYKDYVYILVDWHHTDDTTEMVLYYSPYLREYTCQRHILQGDSYFYSQPLTTLP
jgi:hypothetical protein